MRTNFDYWVYEPCNPSTIPTRVLKSKTYSCPDCPFKDDDTVGCFDCSRGKAPFNIPLPSCPSKITLPYFPYERTYFKTIPEPCLRCPNHPINGGNGNCNCTLDTITFT